MFVRKYVLAAAVFALFLSMVSFPPVSLAARIETGVHFEQLEPELPALSVEEGLFTFTRQDSFTYTTPENLTRTPSHSDRYPSLCMMDNGELWLVWQSYPRHLLKSVSYDTGTHWSPVDTIYTVANDIWGGCIIQSNSGKLFLFYSEWFFTDRWHGDIYYLISEDGGNSWSSPVALTTDDSPNFLPFAAVTSNDWIWVFYNSSRGGSSGMWYTYSTDDGSSWQPHTQLTYIGTPWNNYGSLVERDTLLWVFYEHWTDWSVNDCDIYYKISSNNGASWSDSVRLTYDTAADRLPFAVVDTASNIWIVFTSDRTGNDDIWWVKTIDGGASWDGPYQFTKFLGPDVWSSPVAIQDRVFLAWRSGRPQRRPDIFGGILEYTQDTLNLLCVDYIVVSPGVATQENYVTAFVTDGASSITSVELYWMINGIPQTPLEMYDDGNHGDGAASDSIYGVSVGGGYQVYDTISVRIEAVNADNYHYYAPYPDGYWDYGVRGCHSNNRLWTVLDESDGTIGDGTYLYPSFDWPGGSSHHYLYEGSIQVGYFSDSAHVLNSEEQWGNFEVLSFSWSPFGNTVVSDYQIKAKSDEVEINRKGYSFNKLDYSDFLIFDYWIKNTSTEQLDSVYIGWRYDLDIGYGSYLHLDDWVGYDSIRNLPYMYSSDDSGYVGIMILESPSQEFGFHWCFRDGGDPNSEEEYYNIISDMSIAELPTTQRDYRIHLSTGPFTLNIGDSLHLKMGAVIGDELGGLQENADTLLASVGAGADITLSPDSLYFETDLIAADSFWVGNLGIVPLRVDSVTHNSAWITSVSPPNFTVNFGDSTPVSVTVDPDLLVPHVYSDIDTLWIWSNDPDENPYAEPVKLVMPPCTLSVVDTWGAYGSTNNPMDIEFKNSMAIGGVQFTLNFDDSLLTADSVITTTRTSGMYLGFTTWSDSVRILIFSMSGDSILPGEGPIVDVIFDVDSSATVGDSTLVEISTTILSDPVANPVSYHAVNGWFMFGSEKGDINNDGEINVIDVVRCVNIILGIPPLPTPNELWASDFNGDGEVNVIDIVAIVNIILGKKFTYVMRTIEEPVLVNMTRLPESRADLINIALDITNTIPVAGLQLTIEYDTDIFIPANPQTTERSKGFELAYNSYSGELTILVFNLSGMTIKPGTGAVVSIPLNITSPCNATLKLKNVILAAEDASLIPIEIQSSSVTTNPIPKIYGLSQNYPNPFGDKTDIRYQLPENSNVNLSIYNCVGQLVRELVNEKQKAGYYMARWDSRNNNGKRVVSGIYFYRIMVENNEKKYTTTKKLIIIR